VSANAIYYDVHGCVCLTCRLPRLDGFRVFTPSSTGAWPPLHTTIHRRRPSGRCARGSAGARHGPVVIGGGARAFWCGGARAFRRGASRRCNAAGDARVSACVCVVRARGYRAVYRVSASAPVRHTPSRGAEI